MPTPKKSRLFQPTVTRWFLDGKRLPAAVSGATAVRNRSKVWHGRYWDETGKLRSKSLSTDKHVAQGMLNAVEREVELRRRGVHDHATDHAARPLVEHLQDWQEEIRAERRSPDHLARHIDRTRTVFTEAGSVRIGDINAGVIKRAVDRLARRFDWADNTAAHYKAAAKGFANWLWKSNRLPRHPLASLAISRPRGAGRKVRRALSGEEFRHLLAVTKKSRRVSHGRKLPWRLTGCDRFRLYFTAARTGLRAMELASLTAADFDFVTGTVRAKVCDGNKSKRLMHLPLPPDLVAEIRSWVETLPPGMRLWPGPWAENRHGADMIRGDLREAGIPFKTDEGDFDFHALRVQFGTDIVRAGASVKAAQRLMRHSSATLTINLYAKADATELACVVGRLSPVA